MPAALEIDICFLKTFKKMFIERVSNIFSLIAWKQNKERVSSKATVWRVSMRNSNLGSILILFV